MDLVDAYQTAQTMAGQTYEELDLSRYGLVDETMMILLREVEDVRILDLSHNQIGDGAMQMLSEKLDVWNLEHLDLSHNRIGDTGATYLADHIQGLAFLDLSHNQIGDNGMMSILYGADMGNVGDLNLSYNPVTFVGHYYMDRVHEGWRLCNR